MSNNRRHILGRYGEEAAATELKLAKMRKTIAQWRADRQVHALKLRLDAVSVLVSHGRVHIEHLKQVA